MPLATLADLKTYLGIETGDTAADALLTRVLDATSTQFENRIQRTLASGSRAELRSGNGAEALLLRDWPVASVSLLKIDGQVIPAVDPADRTIGRGYIIDKETIYLRGYRFTLGVKNVSINYVAGYATIPADVQQAVIEIAGQAYKEKDWIGFISKSLAGETVTFARAGIPDSAKITVRAYERVYPCD